MFLSRSYFNCKTSCDNFSGKQTSQVNPSPSRVEIEPKEDSKKSRNSFGNSNAFQSLEIDPDIISDRQTANQKDLDKTEENGNREEEKSKIKNTQKGGKNNSLRVEKPKNVFFEQGSILDDLPSNSEQVRNSKNGKKILNTNIC